MISGFNPVGTRITGYARWGIFCDPAPAVALIQAHFSGAGFKLNGTHVKLNVAGQIGCPGVILP